MNETLVDIEELNIKKELVLDCFVDLYDLDLAYEKVGLTPEEIEFLNSDEAFQQRVKYYLIQAKEALISKLRSLCNSNSPSVALSATMELGKLLYPTKFDRKNNIEEKKVDTLDRLVKNKKDQENNAGEVLRILQESGALESESEDSFKHTIK